MARRRAETDRLRELVRLHRTETSGRRIVSALHLGPATARRYAAVLDAAGLLRGPEAELPPPAVIHAAVVAALGPEASVWVVGASGSVAPSTVSDTDSA